MKKVFSRATDKSNTFLSCIFKIRSSTVSATTTRWMWTFLIWPTLCTRSKACDSTACDHPRSSEMTLLARVRFRPTPNNQVGQIKESSKNDLKTDLRIWGTITWHGPFPSPWILWLLGRVWFESCRLGTWHEECRFRSNSRRSRKDIQSIGKQGESAYELIQKPNPILRQRTFSSGLVFWSLRSSSIMYCTISVNVDMFPERTYLHLAWR